MAMLVYRMRQLASVKDREGRLPVGPATIWRWCREKKFPAPFKLGTQTTVWDASAVDAWFAAKAKGKSA
jgi:prophage regulatory protein